MKKLLLYSLILVGTSFSSAYAYDRCGIPRGHACADFYSRLDAFKRLQAYENGIEDTKENLILVESVRKRFNLSLEYVVDNFIYIQNAVGGADFTSEARETFNLLVNQLPGQNRLHELADMFVYILSSENGISDTQENFSMIASYAQSRRISLYAVTNFFLSILEIEGGPNFTTAARYTFQILLGKSHRYNLDKLLNSYQALFQAENGNSDTVNNFNLVILAADKCGDLMRATNDFLEVLEQVGGENFTSEAQSLYRQLYEI